MIDTWLLVASALTLWIGVTLVLSRVRWFQRIPLTDRLRLYVPGGIGRRGRSKLGVETFRELLGPISRGIGERLGRVFGSSEDLARRLERIHSDLDPTQFRIRQAAWMLAGFGVGGLVSLLPQIGLLAGIALLLVAPLLAFLLQEQQISSASERWQRRIFLELPVVSEQLAMLLSSGYSLTAALNRLATRGTGACATDLQRALRRMRQGLSEIEALREWADLADVTALDRLIPVLALNRESSNLGRLISAEAQAIRRDVQRELIETVEKRGQQVWIPVTVATLLPGVMLLGIPFTSALDLFVGG